MENRCLKFTFLFFVSMVICAFLGIILYANCSITPMDVYQGKTTLKYTVIDGVKVDSTVVWKNKEKQL